MRHSVYGLLFGIVAVAAMIAETAEAGVDEWTVSSYSGFHGTLSEAQSQCDGVSGVEAAFECLASWMSSAYGDCTSEFSNTSVNGPNPSSIPGSWFFTIARSYRSNCGIGTFHPHQMTFLFTPSEDCEFVVELEGCAPNYELECMASAGREIGRWFEGSATSGSVCTSYQGGEEDVCAAVPVGVPFCNGGLCYATLRLTGEQCTSEPPVGEDDQVIEPPPNNNCITSGGLSLCFSKSDPNCGLVNGEPWCASAMPSNGCVSTDSGAVVCTADAWSAPTEADGETPAVPDGEFVAGPEGGTAYEYFRRETVAASGTPVSSGGPGPGGTGSEGPGEDDFEGELGELPTFGEEYLDAEGALASAWNAIASSETVQVWMALGDGLTSSEDCPTPQFELWQETYVIESHCDLAEEIRAELDLVFAFAWALLALVIVGKA